VIKNPFRSVKNGEVSLPVLGLRPGRTKTIIACITRKLTCLAHLLKEMSDTDVTWHGSTSGTMTPLGEARQHPSHDGLVHHMLFTHILLPWPAWHCFASLSTDCDQPAQPGTCTDMWMT
jgi:hypothetical protein